MLSTAEFREFAKSVVPFLHVTSRVEGEKYANLLMEKGGRGFPHVVAMDAEGGVIGVLGERNVAGFQSLMKGAGEFAALAARKDRTPGEEMKFLALEHKLGRVPDADARARAAGLKGLDDAGKKECEEFLFGLDIKAELAKVASRDPITRKAEAAAAGRTFAGWWKEGKEPKDEASVQPFFILMLDYAEGEKDAALFEKALGKLRERFGANPNAVRFFQMQDERLAKLKAPPAAPEGGGEKK